MAGNRWKFCRHRHGHYPLWNYFRRTQPTELSGGNFCYGAATGLIVSGLNRWMHMMKKPLINNGEVFNFFVKEKALGLWAYAESYIPKDKTLQFLEMEDNKLFKSLMATV
jgi:hypothetical protein